jgi:hypothetical protein
MMKLRKTLLSSAAILLLAAPFATAASLSKNPGATLIYPYFEVDLDAPDGRSTLITVANAGEPVVAHATIWTDRGVPVYAWDIYLGENAMATYNLRDILVHGNVAPTRAPASFGGCGDPVATPALAESDLARLQKQLTGRDLGGNNCEGEPREDATLATGSLTIDTVNDCRTGPNQRYPTSFGYFSGPNPRASARQVLWGDLTLVDPAQNFAQGFEAYALGISANPTELRFADWEATAGVARESLGIWLCSRTRFLLGGPFDARTSFFVYTPPPPGPRDNDCDIGEGGRTRWSFGVVDENGQGGSSEVKGTVYRTSGRLEAGADIPTGLSSGYVRLSTYVSGDWGGVPEPSAPIQHLLMGTIQASGRFAVGTAGEALGCD